SSPQLTRRCGFRVILRASRFSPLLGQRGNSTLDCANCQIDLFKRDAQRQHNNHNIVDRSRQQTVIARQQTYFCARLILPFKSAPVSSLDFDPGDKAASSNLPNVGKLADRFQSAAKIFNLRLKQLERLFRFEYPEIREGRGAAKRISSVTVPV